MTAKRWIAYVGPFQFPWGQPGSRRVYGMARTLMEAGYDVVVASGERKPDTSAELIETSSRASLSHAGLDELPHAAETSLQKMKKIFIDGGRRTAAWLDAQPSKPSHVIVYGGAAQYMFYLTRWCAGSNVPLLVDVVEWYNPRQLLGGFFGPLHMSAKFALRKQYPATSGVIAISSYLESYYRQRGSRVVRIPPTLDVEAITVSPPPPSSRLRLVYTGSPGRKDQLADIIAGVGLADPAGDRIRLTVVGPTAKQVNDLVGGSELPPAVQVVGRVEQQAVGAIIQQADFSVLLREPLRFAHAGFPTKFCESLANGTPAIVNLTGDLGDHLVDGREGIVCDEHTAESLAKALKRALDLDGLTKLDMRMAARKRALDSFDFRSHVEPVKGILDGDRCAT